MLSNNEKASIVVGKLKNLSAQKYNFELALIEYNVNSEENSGIISVTNSEIEKINLKVLALQEELNSLEVSPDLVNSLFEYAAPGQYLYMNNVNAFPHITGQ